MKSNQENGYGLPDKLGKFLTGTVVRLGSAKVLLSRLSACLTRKKPNKTKILRAKYKSSGTRKSGYHKHRPNIRAMAWARARQAAEHIPSLLRWKAWTGFGAMLAAKARTMRNAVPRFSLSQLLRNARMPRQLNVKTAAAGVVVLVIAVMVTAANVRVDAYAVEADGRQIAIVASKADAEKMLQDLKAEKARIWKRKVSVRQSLSFKKIKAKKFHIDNPVALKNKMNKNFTFVAVATGIKVNGQVAVIVKDNKTAEEVLNRLKQSFDTEDIKVESVSFQEKVEIAEVPASLADVLSDDKALQVLKEGKQKKVVHIVKEGDSLWSIARAYDMHVADLLKANPAIKGEHLDINQEVNLVALEPVINVVVIGERTVKEAVPYRVVVQTDRSMWRGREKIKTRGENGLKETTYKLVMKNGTVVQRSVANEKVLQNARNQVVIRGSRYVVASRNSGGRLGWPIYGRITSPFGSRWGGRHTGLDIDGITGQPVGAAAAGVVIFAGRDGGYGRMVAIRHSNGLVTRYAHLSKIEVSVGQSVERGDLVGLVGSSGNSTGSHLHFEVLGGGGFQNPIKYLR